MNNTCVNQIGMENQILEFSNTFLLQLLSIAMSQLDLSLCDF